MNNRRELLWVIPGVMAWFVIVWSGNNLLTLMAGCLLLAFFGAVLEIIKEAKRGEDHDYIRIKERGGKKRKGKR